MVYTRKNRKQNNRFRSQIDETRNVFLSVVNIQELETHIFDNMHCEMHNVVSTVESRVHDAILPANGPPINL